MKKLLLLCVLAAALVPVSSAAAASSFDAVFGFGRLNPQFTFGIGAISGPAGQNPFGILAFNDQFSPTTLGFHPGNVSQGCLVVRGNTATVVGLDTVNPSPPVPSGQVFPYNALWVRDNGRPGHGAVDLVGALYLSEPAKARACAGEFPPPPFALTPLQSGDVTVIDG